MTRERNDAPVRLLLDSAATMAVLGVARGTTLVAARHQVPLQGHARDLGQAAHALLAEAGYGYADLDGLVVGIGPGAFTGIRIALAHAQGLAGGLGIPVQPVPSLEAIAMQAPPEVRVMLALDARRGEIWGAVVRGGQVEVPAFVGTHAQLLDAVAALPPAPALWALGDGHPQELPVAVAHQDATASLQAADMLAWVNLHAPEAQDATLVEPRYVRPPDAKLPGGRALIS